MKPQNSLSIMAAGLLSLGIFFGQGAYATDRLSENEDPHCDYPMCRYEKGNIDTVILHHASQSQTVMFGEIHDTVRAGAPPPLEDSRYVITLLSDFHTLGYRYLALEVQSEAPPNTHSADIVRFLADLRHGDHLQADEFPAEYPHAKPGWIELIIEAIGHGYQPILIDGTLPGVDRDTAMYRIMQRKIFDHDPGAKVLVYIGAHHICEEETIGGLASWPPRRKPLGLLLSRHTKGKNYSVYMGFPADTPAGCDLIISNFIWGAFSGAGAHGNNQ